MITNEQICELTEQYNTPLFVFDLDELSARVEEIRNILDKSSENRIGLCYSIKANPFLIPALEKIVDCLEVCSPGELSICIHYNVSAEKIIYSGVNKGKEDVNKAVAYGVKVLTCESLRHYSLICDAAAKYGKKVEILLRLSSMSQFGMSLEDIETIIRDNSDNELITISGIHYFAGTQRAKLKHQTKELNEICEVVKSLRSRYNIDLPKIEYGPGFFFPYFEGDDFSDTLSPIKEFAPELRIASEMSLLTIEMGRFIASSCGYYISSVVDVKHSYNKNWCILDGGINHVNYLGQMMGMKCPVIKLIKKSPEKDADKWVLCGSLCTTNDVLVREYEAKGLDCGDLLVFCNIGAYSITEGINIFLSRTMPSVVLFSGNGAEAVRNPVESWKYNCKMTE